MELKEFVTTTLLAICEGVKDAQEKAGGSRAAINPVASVWGKSDFLYADEDGRQFVQLIEFDVAVATAEGTATRAGAGVTVVPFVSLGASGSSNQTTGTTSRIRFKVPLVLPSAS
jgi:hypothetical protein